MLRYHHRARAFSIVEVLVALAILTVGVFALYEQFVNTGRRGHSEAVYTHARLLAQQKFEQLRSAPYIALASWTPLAAPAPIPDQIQFLGQYMVRPVKEGQLEIIVKVGWDTPPGEDFKAGQAVTIRGIRSR